MLKQMPILINVQAKLENKSPCTKLTTPTAMHTTRARMWVRRQYEKLQFIDFPVKGETGNAQHFGGQGIIPSTLTERPFDGPAFQFL